MTQHRCFETAEAEVLPAGEMRRIAVGVSQTRLREWHRAIVSVGRETIDDWSAGISQPKQLRHLVIRLAGSVITRPSESFVDASLTDAVEAGVSPRHHQHNRWQRHLAVVNYHRLD